MAREGRFVFALRRILRLIAAPFIRALTFNRYPATDPQPKGNSMTTTPPPITPDEPDLNQLIERSAQRGARLALSELGLEDHQAPRDLRDLRNLLIAWRRIRRQALEVMLRVFVQMLLVVMLAMATGLLWFNSR